MNPIYAGRVQKRVANNIAKARAQAGLSLADLAACLGEIGYPIRGDQLSRLENYRRDIDVDELLAFALVLNLTPADLLAPVRGEDFEGTVDVVASTARLTEWYRRWVGVD